MVTFSAKRIQDRCNKLGVLRTMYKDKNKRKRNDKIEIKPDHRTNEWTKHPRLKRRLQHGRYSELPSVDMATPLTRNHLSVHCQDGEVPLYFVHCSLFLKIITIKKTELFYKNPKRAHVRANGSFLTPRSTYLWQVFDSGYPKRQHRQSVPRLYFYVVWLWEPRYRIYKRST